MGMTLDGKISSRTNDTSISNALDWKRVHSLRCTSDAIMVGVGTVIADNPSLTVRHVDCPRQPTRIIIDPLLDSPLDSEVFRTPHSPQTIVACLQSASPTRKSKFSQKGVTLIEMPSREDSHFSLQELLNLLEEQFSIHTLMLEGGSGLVRSMLDEQLIDEGVLYIAPYLLGNDGSVPVISGPGFEKIAEGFKVKFKHARLFAEGILLEFTMENS